MNGATRKSWEPVGSLWGSESTVSVNDPWKPQLPERKVFLVAAVLFLNSRKKTHGLKSQPQLP